MKDKLVAMLAALEAENQPKVVAAFSGIAREVEEMVLEVDEGMEMDENTPIITPEELGELTQKQANQLFVMALLGTGELVQKM